MAENFENSIIPWGCDDTAMNNKKYISATVISVFVQVILQKICFVCEQDSNSNQWINLYETMCVVMVQLKIIDKVYKICEIPTKRNLISIAAKIKGFISSLKALKVQPRTHTTLLIQSLLQILWALVEPDTDNLGNIESQMQKFLLRSSLINESSAMEGLEMIQQEYQRILCHLFFIVRGGKLPSKIMCGLFSSRYLQDFDEVNEKGSGGAGEVFMAVHKL